MKAGKIPESAAYCGMVLLLILANILALLLINPMQYAALSQWHNLSSI